MSNHKNELIMKTISFVANQSEPLAYRVTVIEILLSSVGSDND